MIKNSIIPKSVKYYGEEDTLDHKAMCIFSATGFFLDRDTYYKSFYALPAATIVNDDGSEEKWFEWHYSPRDIGLKQAVEEFAHIFDNVMKKKLKTKILY